MKVKHCCPETDKRVNEGEMMNAIKVTEVHDPWLTEFRNTFLKYIGCKPGTARQSECNYTSWLMLYLLLIQFDLVEKPVPKTTWLKKVSPFRKLFKDSEAGQ